MKLRLSKEASQSGAKTDWDDGDPKEVKKRVKKRPKVGATPRGEKKNEENGAKTDWDDGDPREEAEKKECDEKSVETNWATMSWVATNETPPRSRG